MSFPTNGDGSPPAPPSAPAASPYFTLHRPSRRGLDAIDLRILAILEQDGRASAASLARAVGLTENAIRYRLRKLRHSGVLRAFTVHVDHALLGRPAAAIALLKLAEGTDPNALRALPSLAMLIPTSGPYQAAGLVLARNDAELLRVQEELRGRAGVLEVTLLSIERDAPLPVPPSACTEAPQSR